MTGLIGSNQNTTPLTANTEEVIKTLGLFVRPGESGEIRIIEDRKVSGIFFTHEQNEQAAQMAVQANKTGNVYLVLNPIGASLADRPKLVKVSTNLTKDRDIESRRFFYVDCDPHSPDRKADDSATDSEKQSAKDCAKLVEAYLSSVGFGEPIVANSGNGWHLIYQIDLPNNSASTNLIKAVLKAVSDRFSTDAVKIDVSVCNASRITKLYGTVARKGIDRTDRPHRLSSLVSVPDELKIVPRERLEAVGVSGSLFDGKAKAPTDAEPVRPARATEVVATPSTRLSAGDAIPDGQRNSTLTSLAGHLRRVGLSPDAILAAIRVANEERCIPPLPDYELQKIARNIGGKEPDFVSQYVAEGRDDADPLLDADLDPIEPDAANPGPIPEHLLDVGGLWGEIVEYNLRGAIRPQRELAVAGAGALLGTLYGRKVEGNLNTRTNVYLIGLGESGCGKERARMVAKILLKLAGLGYMLPCEELASASGLIDAVAMCPAMLLMIDEIHKTLAVTKDAGRNPHMFEVIGVLLKLFTCSNSEYLGKAFAGRKRETRIDQPCLSLYGTGIPKGVWQSLTSDQLSDGFLSRLLIIESSNSDPDLCEFVDCSPPPESLIEQIAWWGASTPPKNELNFVCAVPRLVADAPGVTSLFNQGERNFRSFRRPHQQADGLWTRATEKARKLALIHQLSRDREAVEIDEVSAKWALQFVEHVTRQTLFQANVWVTDTKVGGDKLAILRTIRANGGSATLTRINRAHQGLQGRYRDELLKDLVNEGSIRLKIQTESTGKRSPTVFETVS